MSGHHGVSPPTGASQPTVGSSTLHGEVKPVPIGVGGDPAERTVHVVDQVVEVLACELAQATPIRQDPSGIRQPLKEPLNSSSLKSASKSPRSSVAMRGRPHRR